MAPTCRPLRAFDVALHYFNRNPDGYPEGKRAINCRLRRFDFFIK